MMTKESYKVRKMFLMFLLIWEKKRIIMIGLQIFTNNGYV